MLKNRLIPIVLSILLSANIYADTLVQTKENKTITNPKTYIEIDNVRLVKDQEENPGMLDGDFFKAIAAGKVENFTIVYVTDKKTYEKGHLKNAVNIQYEGLDPKVFMSNIDKIIQSGKKVVLVCTSGARATEAITLIQENHGDSKNIFMADANIDCDKEGNCKIEINDPL